VSVTSDEDGIYYYAHPCGIAIAIFVTNGLWRGIASPMNIEISGAKTKDDAVTQLESAIRRWFTDGATFTAPK
jgi:hypothetical protein